ncbi:MAG: tRNA lysidine(34) synthetase TilS [Candidatus Dormibacteria bacterium]
MRRKVAVAADRFAVLTPGETVVIGVSGGPDSTTLLDALGRLAPPRAWTLHAVHVDHGLREGSAAEAAIVAGLAEARGLAFHAAVADLTGSGSLQMRARRGRLRALAAVSDRLGATAIALGHTADDQAETVLYRLLTGGTARSLVAMAPRRGRLVRPLLRVRRTETVAYCAALGIIPLDDPGNRDPRHRRVRIRHEVMPLLESILPGCHRRLLALADAAQADAGSLAAVAEAEFAEAASE